MARIEKGQSYPELGFRVDGKGIAYDLETGAGLAKAQVDARLKGSGMSQLGKKRGGVAGVFDRNKKVIVPLASAALGAVTGGVAAPILLGAASRGLDREGKRGIGLDAGQALRGAVEGGVAGFAGKTLAQDGLGGTISKLGNTAKKYAPTLLGAAKKYAPTVLGAIPALESYNRAKEFEKQAKTQVNNATQGNNTMAELAKALIARGGGAPSAGPDLSNLVDTQNPYYKKLRPRIGPPSAPAGGV